MRSMNLILILSAFVGLEQQGFAAEERFCFQAIYSPPDHDKQKVKRIDVLIVMDGINLLSAIAGFELKDKDGYLTSAPLKCQGEKNPVCTARDRKWGDAVVVPYGTILNFRRSQPFRLFFKGEETDVTLGSDDRIFHLQRVGYGACNALERKD